MMEVKMRIETKQIKRRHDENADCDEAWNGKNKPTTRGLGVRTLSASFLPNGAIHCAHAHTPPTMSYAWTVSVGCLPGDHLGKEREKE